MTTLPGSPIDRVLTWSLLVVPVGYLLADLLYALRGWDDPTAGVLHVVFATLYGLVALQVVALTAQRPGWSLAVLLAGAVGTVGNAAYGFETVHVSLGHTALVHTAGAANLIKPYGLAFPLTLFLAAVALVLAGRLSPVTGIVFAITALLWPVAHIANLGWLAVAVNAALIGVFAQLWHASRTPGDPGAGDPAPQASHAQLNPLTRPTPQQPLRAG